MKINKVLGGLFLFASLVFVSPVFAGGGPVEFTIDPNTSLNPGEQYIVHARVYADGSYPTYCKNCYIKLALQNPQDSDYIVQNSNATNDEGRIYAKIISKVPGNRTIYVSELRNADGSRITANSTVVLKYTGETFTEPEKDDNKLQTPQLALANEYNITNKGQTRSVKLVLNLILNAITYTIYTKEAGKDNWVEQTGGAYSTTAWVYVDPNKDYYLKARVFADKYGWSDYSNEVFLSKQATWSINDKKFPDAEPSKKPQPTITPKPSVAVVVINNNKELEQKVASIEAQLAQSKNKENILEQRINDLVNFLKHLFPFFK